MPPQGLLGTGLDRRISETLFCPDADPGAFRTPKSRSTIDYFLISDRMATAVGEVKTVEGSGVKCHVPVQVIFKPEMAMLRALHVRMPPKLPTQRVFGPIPPPLDWTAPLAMTQASLEAARANSSDLGDWMEKAYAAWANKAEEELEAFTGGVLPKRGERAKRPKLVWRSILPEKRRTPCFPERAAIIWLRGITAEVQRIAGVLDKLDGEHDEPRGTAPNADDPMGNMQPESVNIFPHHDLHADADDDAADDDAMRDDTLNEDEHPRSERRGRGPPTDRVHCMRVLDDIAASLVADFPEGTPTDHFMQSMADITALVDSIRGGDGTLLHDGLPPHRRMRADDLRERLDAIVSRVERVEDKVATNAWKQWIREDFDAGARRAHACTRLPQEAVPTAAKMQGGTMSSRPEALLGAQRDKFRAHWRPADGAYHYKWPSRDELPLQSPGHLRETALTFPWKTASTFDGFHPRQLADLTDDALTTLATLLQAVEVSGRWPRQVRMVMTPLLPKPKGGFRPIGLMAGVYRLWA